MLPGVCDVCLQDCFGGEVQLEAVWRTQGALQLGSSRVNNIVCPQDSASSHKSFPSGHSSVSSCIMTYNIVYLLWAGYLRAEGASFMGLRRQTGWRGGRRFFREIGHGFYLLWILMQFAFVWAVGVSRYADNKHHVSDVRPPVLARPGARKPSGCFAGSSVHGCRHDPHELFCFPVTTYTVCLSTLMSC